VDLANYSPANSRARKLHNWVRLQSTTFRKLGFKIHESVIRGVVDFKDGTIERLLIKIRALIATQNRSVLNYRIGKKHVPLLEMGRSTGAKQGISILESARKHTPEGLLKHVVASPVPSTAAPVTSSSPPAVQAVQVPVVSRSTIEVEVGSMSQDEVATKEEATSTLHIDYQEASTHTPERPETSIPTAETPVEIEHSVTETNTLPSSETPSSTTPLDQSGDEGEEEGPLPLKSPSMVHEDEEPEANDLDATETSQPYFHCYGVFDFIKRRNP